MTRWLVAFWIATVLLCTGMAVPGTALAASPVGVAFTVALADSRQAGEADLAASDGQSLPAIDSEQREPPAPENAWDGAELLGPHPAVPTTATRSQGPPAFFLASLPQPYLEGPQRPPRATALTA